MEYCEKRKEEEERRGGKISDASNRVSRLFSPLEPPSRGEQSSKSKLTSQLSSPLVDPPLNVGVAAPPTANFPTTRTSPPHLFSPLSSLNP